MPIDAGQVHYYPVLILPDGNTMDLSGVAEDLTWEEQQGEFAMRLQLNLPNVRTSRGYLNELLNLNGRIALWADWGTGKQPIMLGTIMDVVASDDGTQRNEVTVYDDLIRMQGSDHHMLVADGADAKATLLSVFNEYSIPLGQLDGPNCTLPKLRLSGKIGDVLSQILTRVFVKEGQAYLIRCRYDGKRNVVDVVKPATNERYWFTSFDGTSTASDRQSILDLVTQVKVMATEPDTTLPAPISTEEGENKGIAQAIQFTKNNETFPPETWGLLRRVVTSTTSDSQATLDDQVDAILEEFGAPKRVRDIEVVDLPFARKGDMHRFDAGTVIGYQLISGIQHTARNQRMRLTIDSSGTFKHRQKKVDDKSKDKVPDEASDHEFNVNTGTPTSAKAIET